MHFSTVALFGRYQDSGMDGPLRELAKVLEQAHVNVLCILFIKENQGEWISLDIFLLSKNSTGPINCLCPCHGVFYTSAFQLWYFFFVN